MTQMGVAGDVVDAGRHRNRRVHQNDIWPGVVQPVRDGLGVECRDCGLRKEPSRFGKRVGPRASSGTASRRENVGGSPTFRRGSFLVTTAR